MAAVPWSVHKGERDSKAEYADDEIRYCALGIVGAEALMSCGRVPDVRSSDTSGAIDTLQLC